MSLKRSRARDYDEIKSPEDIIHRWSRPQRNSSFVPNRRDWRYETGVYQRKDFDGSKGDKTIWDILDEDCVSGVFGRERRRVRRDNSSLEEGAKETLGHKGYEPGAVGVEMRTGLGTSVGSPIDTNTPASTPREKGSGSLTRRTDNFPTRSVELYGRAANSISSNAEEEGDQVGLTAQLRFPWTNPSVKPMPGHQPNPTCLSFVPGTPVAPSISSSTPYLDHGDSSEALPPFHGEWGDNTRNFCMKKVQSLIRHSEKLVDPIPISFQWWDSAVPVDAILPPGIAMSAKELNAYYPHHIRWKSVAMRLFNNSYDHSDIMKIQSFFRSSPEFPVDETLFRVCFQQSILGSDHTVKASDLRPKTDMNFYTEAFSSTQFVERRGYTVPTFDDLLKGLKLLPTGLDARELTQCLVWYLNSADKFNPRLELNVLHVQSLVRALRDPLRSHGIHNLDIIGLNEFHEHDAYPNSRELDHERMASNEEKRAKECRIIQAGNSETKDVCIGGDRGKRILQLHVDSGDGTLTVTASISVRSVLQFPFLAMHRLVAEALRMGITNAQAKKAMRERSEREQHAEKPGNNSNGAPIQDRGPISVDQCP